jgi:dGTPase
MEGGASVAQLGGCPTSLGCIGHDRLMQEINGVGGLRRRDRAAREAEEERLSPAATRSTASRGRERPEEPDEFRTAFERDRDRIIHSKAFRRLKHKTQVFLNPEGDHFVTRLTHTMQVTQVARALAGALSLNEPLAEAIALGHDVGHSPFGHTGEDALSPYFAPDEWHHAAQSVRIFEILEDQNLTWEVRDGIRAHSWKIDPPPATPEAFCVRFADRIAYLAHDGVDALRAGVLDRASFPPHVIERFGEPGRPWINSMITAVIDVSLRTGSVRMADDTLAVMNELRDFMFTNVYQSAEQLRQQQRAIAVIRDLMDWHLAHPEEIPGSYRQHDAPAPVQAADYIAGMTDRFALATHDRLFRPTLNL